MPRAIVAQHWSFRPLERLFRRAPLLGWTVAGFIVTAGVLHAALPAPLQLYAQPRSEKLAMLQSRRATVNAAAFGSSRVHNGFDPSVFNATLGHYGYAMTSLNLAIYGGSQTEQRALARDFAAHLVAPASPPRVCLVLLELNAGLNFQTTNLFHPRNINLYDLDTVLFALRFSGDSLGLVRRFGRAGIALASGVLHLTNVGMLGETLFEPVPEAPGERETRDALLGLLSEDPVPAGLAGVRHAFEMRPDEAAAETVPILPGNRQIVADIASAADVSNLQFVYFVTPTLDDLKRAPLYPDSINGPDGPVPVFNFALPSKYPQLFQETLWWDPGHLNRAGAAVFSRLLAAEVGAWIAKTPRASRCGD